MSVFDKEKLTQWQLDKMVHRHELWLKGSIFGKRLVLDNVDLSRLSIAYRDLSHSIIRNVDANSFVISNCTLNHCEIQYCNFDYSAIESNSIKYSTVNNIKLNNSHAKSGFFSYCSLYFIFLNGCRVNDVWFYNSSIDSISATDDTVIEETKLKDCVYKGVKR